MPAGGNYFRRWVRRPGAGVGRRGRDREVAGLPTVIDRGLSQLPWNLGDSEAASLIRGQDFESLRPDIA